MNTYRGRTFTQATASAHAVGLADLVVRTKYTLFAEDTTGIAALVDVRLPTGRAEDLLGAGSAAVKFSAIGSLEQGRLSAHANTGVSFGGLARELSYGGAVALAASGHVSVIGELLGRWIDSPGHIVPVTAPHPLLERRRDHPPDAGRRRACTMLTLVPGVKWNLTETWVLAANVSIPLTNGGLTAPFTPFIGLDYSLGR